MYIKFRLESFSSHDVSEALVMDFEQFNRHDLCSLRKLYPVEERDGMDRVVRSPRFDTAAEAEAYRFEDEMPAPRVQTPATKGLLNALEAISRNEELARHA